MAGMTERLALIIDAQADGATREIKKLGTEAKKTDDATEKLSKTASTMGMAFRTAAMIGIGYAAIKLVKFAGDSIAAASDLSETVNKVGVVFGDTSDEVVAFGKGSAQALGLSKNAALGAAATFGQFFDAAGMGGKAVTDMSLKLVKLSADMSSFQNADPSEVLQNLRSGLAGEAEPLRKFGVFLSEATIKAYAYANGIAAAGAELTEAQKIQARYGVILEQTSAASGDFERTSAGLANQQRILSASVEDLKASLGEALLPAMQKGVSAATGLLDVFSALPPNVQVSAIAVTGLGGVAAVTVPKILELKKAVEGLDRVTLVKGLGKAGVTLALAILAGKTLEADAATQKFVTTWKDAAQAFESGASAEGLKGAEDALARLVVKEKELQDQTPGIGKSFAQAGDAIRGLFGDSVSESVDKAREKLTTLGTVWETTLKETSTRTGLTRVEVEKLAETFGVDLSEGGFAAAAALTKVYEEQVKSTVATQELDAVSKVLLDTTAEMKDKTDAYTGALNSMLSTVLGVTNAEIGFQGTVDSLTDKFVELTEATKDGDQATRDKAAADLNAARALDINEESGRAVVTMLGKLAQDAASVASETYKQTGSVAQATSVYNAHVGQIDKVIGELGLNKEAVKGLIGQYDRVPASITTAVNAETAAATQGISTFLGTLARIPRKTTTYLETVLTGASPYIAAPRAIGGPVTAGDPYLVGENGPELFVPGQSGSIVPNGALMGNGRGGGTSGMIVNVYVAGSVRQDRDLARVIRDELARLGRRGDPMAA